MKGNRRDFAAALAAFILKNRKAIKVLPLILADTLGREIASTHLAAAWGVMFALPNRVRDYTARVGMGAPSKLETTLSPANISRAVGSALKHRSPAALVHLVPQLTHAEFLFETVLAHPEGLWFGKTDPENNFSELRTDDRKVHLYIPEMEEWLNEITPENEEKALRSDPEFLL